MVIKLEVPPDRYDNNCMMNKAEVREQIQQDVIAYMEPLLDREYEFTNDNVIRELTIKGKFSSCCAQGGVLHRTPPKLTIYH